MEQQLLDLIGPNDGAEMPFDEWVAQARSAGLRPDVVQKLKRRGTVHTRLTPEGVNMIVRGPRPEPTN